MSWKIWVYSLAASHGPWRCVVSGLGDGGVGVFVGTGGRSGVDGFGTNEYSDVFSDHGSPLDCVNESERPV